MKIGCLRKSYGVSLAFAVNSDQARRFMLLLFEDRVIDISLSAYSLRNLNTTLVNTVFLSWSSLVIVHAMRLRIFLKLLLVRSMERLGLER